MKQKLTISHGHPSSWTLAIHEPNAPVWTGLMFKLPNYNAEAIRTRIYWRHFRLPIFKSDIKTPGSAEAMDYHTIVRWSVCVRIGYGNKRFGRGWEISMIFPM